MKKSLHAQKSHLTLQILFFLLILVPRMSYSQTGNNCNSLANLTCGQPISSTTVGGGNDFTIQNYACHSSSNLFDAEDKVYKIVPSVTGAHEILLSGLTKDLDLFLFSNSCTAGTCIAKSTQALNYNDKININLSAGASYYIVVDGYNPTQACSFQLSLTCPSSPVCASGITELNCGEIDTFTTAGKPSQYSTPNFTSCMAINNSSFSAGDRVFKYKHTASNPHAVLSIWGYTKDLDLFVFNSCYTNAHCIKAAKNKQDKTEYIDFSGLPYGDYYIVVDGYDAAQVSSFFISVSCQQICKQQSITTPINCDQTVSGNTSNGAYIFSKYSCDPSYEFTGPEKYYSFKAPSADSFRISLFGFNCDLELFITEPFNCKPYPVCKKSSLNSSGHPEYICIYLQKDEIIYIVVDGSLGDHGPFQLKVSCPDVDRCLDAEVISCGIQYTRNTLNSGNTFNKSDYANCCQTNSTYNGNDKVFKYTHTSANKNAQVVLCGFDTDLDLFLLTSCDSNAHCVDFSIGNIKKYEVIDFSNKPYGDYYIVVDGYNASQNDTFSISVSCQYECTDNLIEPITCNTTIQSNTSNGVNRFSKYSCFPESQFTGKEKYYRFKALQSGEHVIDLSCFNIDLELFVVENIHCAYNPVCKAKSINPPGHDEQIKIFLQKNETIDIIVDGALGAQGPFTLKVNCPNVDRCLDAEVISCGIQYTRNTLNSGNTFNNSDYANCCQTNSTYNGNDKVFKYTHTSANKNAQVVLCGFDTDLDLFLLTSCDSNAHCVDFSISNIKKYEVIDFSNKPYGDYYIVVDGYNASQNDTFSISVSCQYECSDNLIEPITCNATIQSNTSNGVNKFSKYSCFPESQFTGKEKYYRFKALQSGEHVIDLNDFKNDLELFVVENIHCAYNPVCKAISTNAPGHDEQIKIFLQKNEIIDIIVDGKLGAEGSFALKIKCPTDKPIIFDVSDSICDLPGKTVQIPVKVKNFKNVTSFSMTVKSANPNIVQIKSISSGTLNVVSHFVNELNKTITITFLGANPATLADGVTAFLIEAVLAGNASQSALIQIVDSPTEIKVVVTENNQNSLYPVETTNGSICILTPPPSMKLKFDVDDNVCDSKGTNIQIPVRVSGFKNIRSFSMTVTVDSTSILQINSISSPLSGLTYFEATSKKTFTLQMLSNNGITLADGSIAYNINATLVGKPGQIAQISIVSIPTNIQAIAFENNQNLDVPVEVMGGSACVNGVSLIDFTGKIIDRHNAGIKSAQVKLRGTDSINVETPANGTYSFNDRISTGNYTISVMKNTNANNGIDLLDLALLQDHIITRTILTDPYKLLAADINRDGSIDILDLAELQDLIITRITTFTKNTSWIFIPTDETLTATKVFNRTYRTTRIINMPATDQSNLDFYGVKIGDINQSANTQTFIQEEVKLSSPIEQQSDANLTMKLPSMNVKKEQIIYMPLILEKFNDIRGFQFVISWDQSKLEYIQTESFNTLLSGFNESNIVYNAQNPGIINSLWLNTNNNSLPENTQLFVLVFKVKANEGETFPVTFKDVKALEVAGSIQSLKYTESKITVSDISTAFKQIEKDDLLIRVYPNPTSNNLNLKSESPFEIREIIDSKGTVYPVHLKSKLNYTIDLQSYPSGVYFLKTISDQKTRVHKFILNK